jgi:hypothetical protein
MPVQEAEYLCSAAMLRAELDNRDLGRTLGPAHPCREQFYLRRNSTGQSPMRSEITVSMR